MIIVAHPNPILYQKTSDINVAQFGRQKLLSLAEDMLITMHKAKGVGLAAPQIGESIRLAVIAKQSEDLILVNPCILARSVETDTVEEGCLSIPGVLVAVPRSIWVKVRAENLSNRPYEFEAHGFFARVVQHEIDHLDGVLIIDKK